MKMLVIAQHEDALNELAYGASALSDKVIAVAVGFTPSASCAQDVYTLSVPKENIVDDCAASLISLYEQEAPDAVLVESTRSLKVVAGRLGAHAQTAVIVDALSLVDGVAETMYFGGVGIRMLKPAGKGIFVVSPSIFEGEPVVAQAAVSELPWVDPPCAVALVEARPIEKSGVDLTKAEIVVGAGRGFAEEDDLDLARSMCDKLGAGLGCSRPLTEGVNWLPTETYIGVSGLMLSPKVYIALGISGQMQHMVGCNRADVVFAINKDKNAPIFKQSDYGIVGDLKTVLPALLDLL
ncbi:MAG: electron transfer flavoprotein subunit alpha/FixB family protein [Raoultibacter sp.]